MKNPIKKWFDKQVTQAIKGNLDHYQNELATARQEIYQLQNMVAYMVHHTPANKETSDDWKKIKQGDFSPVGFQLLQNAGFVGNAVEMEANDFLDSLRDNGGI